MEGIKSGIIAGLVTFIVIFFSIRGCNRQEEKLESRTIDSTSIYKGRLAEIQAQGEARIKKWKSDSLEMKASAMVYKQAATKATKERDIARRNIQIIVDTIPEVKEFVRVDSLSDKLNRERIDALGLENVKITNDFLQIVHSRDEELKVSHEYTAHLQVVIVELKADLKRQIRRKFLWKAIAIVISGGLVGTSFGIF